MWLQYIQVISHRGPIEKRKKKSLRKVQGSIDILVKINKENCPDFTTPSISGFHFIDSLSSGHNLVNSTSRHRRKAGQTQPLTIESYLVSKFPTDSRTELIRSYYKKFQKSFIPFAAVHTASFLIKQSFLTVVSF